MKINSSNQNMENVFSVLSEIKKTEPKKDLLTPTLAKINAEKIIPLRFVYVAASIFILFLSTEFIFVRYQNKVNQFSNLVPQFNNILYHE